MRQTSKVTVTIGGVSLATKAGSSTLFIGGWFPTGDLEYTYDEQLIYKEIQRPSRITTTLVHIWDSDLAAVNATRSATILYVTDTGFSYSMANGMCVSSGELTDGEVKVTFQGEMMPSPSKKKPDPP